jgi:NAD(P)H dehydrogenase (quinone)
MPKILVLFHSRSGNTATLADAIAEGARGVRFTEVDVRRLEDLGPESLVDAIPAWKEGREALARKYRALESAERIADYDGIAIGSPGHFGAMSAELRSVLDQLGPLASRRGLVDKVGAAFTTALASRGGHESTLTGMATALASLGMILCPPGLPEAAAGTGAPLGAVALTGAGAGITAADLENARALGKRLAKVSEWVRHAKGHEAHGHHHH